MDKNEIIKIVENEMYNFCQYNSEGDEQIIKDDDIDMIALNIAEEIMRKDSADGNVILRSQKTEIMKATDKQIKELKQLLWIFDSKHNVSVPQTEENINYIADEIVKLFATTDVSRRFSIGQKVMWEDIDYWVVEDNGQPKVLVANSENRHDDEYNDWWVYRYELNAC